MCLILLSYETHSPYRLAVAANRDEFHARPTRSAHFWEDEPSVLAGRDLESGGTWMGVSRSGRFAAVTNFSETVDPPCEVRSRGHLVSTFLAGQMSTQEYLRDVDLQRERYRGFSLLTFDGLSLGYGSNRGGDPRILQPGVYGLANHLLDANWPKVEFGKPALARVLEEGPNDESVVEGLLDVLGSEDHFYDVDLPHDDSDQASLQCVSPLFIRYPVYGTRASTILLLRARSFVFAEQAFLPTGSKDRRKSFVIDIDSESQATESG